MAPFPTKRVHERFEKKWVHNTYAVFLAIFGTIQPMAMDDIYKEKTGDVPAQLAI